MRDLILQLSKSSIYSTKPMDITSQKVVPTRGAISRANFSGNVGLRAIIRLVDTLNNPLPFGATVSDPAQENYSSIVNDNGMVYLTGLQETGSLKVQWGKKSTQMCTAAFSLQTAAQNAGITQSQAVCR
ncbi:hypothetical protein DMR29_27625 [Klebsiella variicola]|nr:hypothetical protein DMR29_27625 [Klebsiella variicola]